MGRALKAGRTEGAARELAILNAAAEALNSATDARAALERTLNLVADWLGLDTGWVWLRDADSGQFYLAAARNLPPYLQEPVRMTGSACWCIEAFQHGALSAKNVGIIECSRLRPALRSDQAEAARGLAYHASLPLAFQDTPLGIINVTAPGLRELTAEELRLLSTVAYQVGLAVERARLAEESARLARAEERARLAREIHDTLAQGLTAIGLQVESALHHLESDPATARERLERVLTTTRENLEEARRSVDDLRAAPLVGRPLGEALAALGRQLTSETGVPMRLRVTGPANGLPLRVEAQLFRVAQEALTNVRKHAHATEVTVALRHDPDRVGLTIHDDGRGLANAAEDAPGGFGLTGMRERARLLGGSLRVLSPPGGGTTVSLWVPLPAAMTP
jgi:two-component system NarL family sensor kinase